MITYTKTKKIITLNKSPKPWVPDHGHFDFFTINWFAFIHIFGFTDFVETWYPFVSS